jgi:hypothetical protein
MTPPTATAEFTAAPPSPPASAERPVFAAKTSARPRALRLAGRAAAGLVGLWLVALVLGAFGFGKVPGIELPRIVGDEAGGDRAAHSSAPPPAAPSKHAIGVTLRARPHAIPTAPKPRLGTRTTHGGPQVTRGGAGSTTHTGSRNPGTTPSHGTPGTSAPTTVSTPAATASPAPTTTAPPASSSSGSSSKPTPRGSSSNAPGSRSQAGTAPGRQHSSASPSPGGGAAEHKPPKG